MLVFFSICHCRTRGSLIPRFSDRGQGRNHGIADAANVKKALSAYSAELIDRAGDEVVTSKENTEMLHDWSRMSNSPVMQRDGQARLKSGL